MASRDLVYTIGVDASDATAGLRKLESSVRSTMRTVDDEMSDGATAGDKFAASVDEIATRLREDFGSAATAAEELQRALRDAGSGLDVGDAINTLRRMGVSFDEITADADKFATSLKQLDDVRIEGVKDLDSVAPGLATKLDNVEKSANSSKGALANMIGNSAQDLGELGGIAGSTGVAVGQMAEYFADAAFEGEGLGSVLKNFAGVAGPILLITAAVSAITGAMEAQKRRSEEAAEAIEQVGTAMRGVGDDALGLADTFRDNATALRDFETNTLLGKGAMGDLANTLNDAGKAIPLLGNLFQDLGVDAVKALADSGKSAYAFGKALQGSAADRAKFLEDLDLIHAAGFITSDQFHALTELFDEQATAVDKAREAQKIYNVTQDEANALLEEAQDPLTRYTDLWGVLFADLADGKIDTKAAADAVNELSDKLGLAQDEVLGLAQQHLEKTFEEQAQAAEQAAEAAKAYAIAVAGAESSLRDLTTQAAVWTQRGGIMSSLLGDVAGWSEAKGNVRDIAIAIGELPEELSKVKVGDVLANATSADALLDKLDSIGGQVRERIADAFATGGPEAANQMASDYVDQVTAALGGKFTREQVADLLGLGDVKATIDLAVKEDAIARVKATIAAVTGVAGQTPFTASIGLAVDAGTLSASAAQAIANWQAQEAGIDVPFEPVTDPAAVAEANAFMAAYAAQHPVTQPLTGDAQGVTDAADAAKKDAAKTPAVVPVDANTKDATTKIDSTKDTAAKAKPMVDVSANIATALITMAIINVIAQQMAPRVSITADATSAVDTLHNLSNQRPRVPATVYVADYPTSAEIVQMIGRPRVPVDIVVGQSIRITGVRE